MRMVRGGKRGKGNGEGRDSCPPFLKFLDLPLFYISSKSFMYSENNSLMEASFCTRFDLAAFLVYK